MAGRIDGSGAQALKERIGRMFRDAAIADEVAAAGEAAERADRRARLEALGEEIARRRRDEALGMGGAVQGRVLSDLGDSVARLRESIARSGRDEILARAGAEAKDAGPAYESIRPSREDGGPKEVSGGNGAGGFPSLDLLDSI